MNKNTLPSVFIMNVSYTGLALARELSEMGIRVYGIGSKRWVPGNFSRCLRFVHSPDSLNEKEKLCEFMVRLSRTEREKPVVFPTRDHDVLFLAEFRDILEKYYIYPLPENSKLISVYNKWELYKSAVGCEITVPNTYLVESDDDLRKIETSMNFPAVIKPVLAADWRKDIIWEAVGQRKAIFVTSRKGLWNSYQKFASIAPRILVQDYIEGSDNDIYTFCSYCNKKFEIIAGFNTQKIRQIPELFGTGVIVKSSINEELTGPSTRILNKLNFSGISEIEYKRDPKTGKYYMIEINPRFWDQHELSRSFGLNLPLIAYFDLIGKNVERRTKGNRQMTWIAEDSVIPYLISKMIADKEDLLRMIREMRGSKIYATWRLQDPAPFAVAMLLMMIGLARGAERKVSEWMKKGKERW